MSREKENPLDLMKVVKDLQAEVSQLKARQEVQDVYIRYGRGIDRLDETSYFSAFWSDAQINYGTAESITPAEHWANHMQKGFKETAKAWGHLLTNLAADIQDDVAHVEIYLTVLCVPREWTTGKPTVWAGRYIDRVDRRNGEWRIAVREYIPHFALTADTIAPHAMFLSWLYKDAKPELVLESWSPRDPSYARPLSRRAKEAGPSRAK
jgi:hypothetical protein